MEGMRLRVWASAGHRINTSAAAAAGRPSRPVSSAMSGSARAAGG